MTGEQKQAASPYRCNEDDLGCLNDYFMAALQGEESKAALQRLWDQQMGIIRHNAYNAVIHDLFPYRDGSGKRLGEEYRKVQNGIKELEGERP